MLNKTGLQFTFQLDGLANDTFSVLDFSGEEALSSTFHFNITLTSRLEAITPLQTVDRSGVLKIRYNNVVIQQRHGIVCEFHQGDTGHHHTIYKVVLVPALQRLSLRQNSRIFQELTVPQIIECIFSEMGISDYAFALTKEPAVREYCVQYRETDLAFVERIAAEEGIYYYFSHEEALHTVCFADEVQTAPVLPSALEYNTQSGGVSLKPFVRDFRQQARIRPSSVQLKDYSFHAPGNPLLGDAYGDEMDYQRLSYEHFDYPGRYKKDQTGTKFSQVRLEHLRSDALTASGSSNSSDLTAGYKFTLKEHPSASCNRDWFTTAVSHSGTQPQALEEAGASGATTYNNDFVVIPDHRQWKPTQNPKPCVDGPQMAIVVGPEGEEIFCDKHGRVKVHFPWDIDNPKQDDTSSCWIRVSQGWAGGQYGHIAIPRIGHEVIVSFLEGDPDRPIITGRAYHASNKVPYALPANKTRTVLRTQTHMGEGYNEVRFEDEADKEEIFIQAQRNSMLLVENDRTDDVKHDWHTLVDNINIVRTNKDSHQMVEGAQKTHITQDQSILVSGSLHIKDGTGHLVEAGTEIHIKSGAKVVIEAGTEITVKAGGSFIKLEAAGISISGAAIDLNAGGAAVAGSGYNGELPLLPGIASDIKLPCIDPVVIKPEPPEIELPLDIPHYVFSE